MLYIDTVEGKGRGVFTDTAINKDEVIERCPVLIIPQYQLEAIDETILFDYYFSWKDEARDGAVALGYGSLYNHSYTPNAVYKRIVKERILEFMALDDIEAGGEILVNYNGDPDSAKPLWKLDEIKWKN